LEDKVSTFLPEVSPALAPMFGTMGWILIFGSFMLAWSNLSIMGSERVRLEREAQQKRARNAASATPRA
jgi:hypothetical protein